MSDFNCKAARTRASIVVVLEQALAAMGESFVKLGEALRSEDKDAEDRAKYLQSEEGRNVWGSVWRSDVLAAHQAITEFDKIVAATESGPYRYQVALSNDNFAEGTDRTKLEHLIGPVAVLKKYLAKAGFKLEMGPAPGMYKHIVITRP